MKKKLSKIVLALGVLFLMVVSFTLSTNNLGNQDVTLENIAALNQADAETTCVLCLTSASVCATIDGDTYYGTFVEFYYVENGPC